MPELRQQLQSLFGLDDFRPAQRGVIESVIAGRDVMCVMPTGAGKSLCYQLPAALSGRLSIVISPLVSLMEDQVQQLRDQGVPAMLLNSTLTPAQQRQAIAELEKGFSGLLYVAPERFFLGGFGEMAARLKPALLAIDEAHCISQWGHDFRPEYHRLGEVRRLLKNPPTIALTATATDDVRADIIHHLQLNQPEIVITGFDRPTLSYQCRRVSKNVEKDEQLLKMLRDEPGTCIVYCATRKKVQEVHAMLSGAMRGRAIFAYHAGMEMGARTESQEQFMESPNGIAIATNAFGMGINKPNVRLVVHYNIPGTLEAYYQEAGRAGRDGQPARCVLMYSFQDRFMQEFFISKIGEENEHSDPALIEEIKDHARQKLEIMIRYAQANRCRRQMILDYFGDEASISGCQCDACVRVIEPYSRGEIRPEVVTLVRQLLSGVARCNAKFGVGTVAEALAGSEDEKMARWGLNNLKIYGLLKPRPIKQIIAMLHRLIENGLVGQRGADGNQSLPLVHLTPLGIETMKGAQLPPPILDEILPRQTAAISKPKFRPRSEPNIDIDPASAERFEKLRAVRMKLAQERQLPPYCICHDSTLKLIATERPADAAALEGIKGMGPMKISMYGGAFLAAIGERAPQAGPLNME